MREEWFKFFDLLTPYVDNQGKRSSNAIDNWVLDFD